MFGLTRREQRWKAEQKAVETVIPLLTAAIQAGTASRDIDDEKNKAVAAATAPLLARIAELEAANEAFSKRQEWWNTRMVELEKELAEVREDAERLRAMPMKYRRMAFNAELQQQVDELSSSLNTVRTAAVIAWKYAQPVISREKTSPSNSAWMVEALEKDENAIRAAIKEQT